MKYFSETEYQQLIQNGCDESEDKDYPPVAKLFMTNTACTWLISELNPEVPTIAFGLCDLGLGFPELGYVDISEIEAAQDKYKFRFLERDLAFEGKFPVSLYSKAARRAGEIVTENHLIEPFVPKPQ